MKNTIIKWEKSEIRVLIISERKLRFFFFIQCIHVCNRNTMSSYSFEGRIFKYIIVYCSDKLESWSINIKPHLFFCLPPSCIDSSFSFIDTSSWNIVHSDKWLIISFTEKDLFLRIKKNNIYRWNRYASQYFFIKFRFDKHNTKKRYRKYMDKMIFVT